MRSIRLGRIFGIPVGLDLSLLLIAGLLTLSLAADRFPAEFPGEPTAAYWFVGLVTAGLFFASVLAHEIAHSLVARRHGVQVDGITLWMLGGVAKLGGESPSAGAELLIAAAGPATSVGLAAAFGLSSEPVDDRFRISLAVLGLLAEAAEARPVACFVDDAQWLDQASADALMFAARRFEADRIALLFAVRDDPARPFVAPGVADIRIDPLGTADAQSLARSHSTRA